VKDSAQLNACKGRNFEKNLWLHATNMKERNLYGQLTYNTSLIIFINKQQNLKLVGWGLTALLA